MDFLCKHIVELSLVIMIVYVVFLWRITGRKRDSDKLLGAFAVVAVLGAICHWVIFCKVANLEFAEYDNWIIKILFAIQYSLEMFLANTIVYKGEVVKALANHKLLFHSYLLIYGMAILTSGFVVFHFLSRRIYTWLWLRLKRVKPNAHIFIGINDAAKSLVKDINSNDQIIFIDVPNQNGLQGMSIMDVIARFFKTREKQAQDQKWLDKYVVLRADRGIGKITKWFEQATTKVYILSDNQDDNIAVLGKLWEHKDVFQCKIFCHAKKEGLVNRYDSITDNKDRIMFVDSSFLAVQELKKTSSMLPVHYVQIAEDEARKQKLGYVESSFNCAVIGFGETGKETVKFLYEFGAFPNAANGKAPFKCHIFDGNLEKELGEFGLDITTIKSTAAQDDEFELHPYYVGTNAFRAKISSIIKDLNYIVVSLGNDNLNVETALNIAECAMEAGKDLTQRFCIAVRLTTLSKLNEDTIAEANKTFGNCIKIFGLTENIWKMKTISNEEIDKEARKFYESYKMHSNVLNSGLKYDLDPTWDEREKMLCEGTYEERCEIRRKRAQDFSNSLHVTTKRKLCEGYDTHKTKVVDQILDANEGDDEKVHCKGDYCEILEHLAVCEHLRWEASHMIMGYRPVAKDGDPTDEMKKFHKYIKPYSLLPEHIKHYDWLVVKNSLKIYNS